MSIANRRFTLLYGDCSDPCQDSLESHHLFARAGEELFVGRKAIRSPEEKLQIVLSVLRGETAQAEKAGQAWQKRDSVSSAVSIRTDTCITQWSSKRLVEFWAAPQTIALMAIGVEHADQLLVTAGDNRERLRSEAAFTHLCRVAPIPASSGRLHRGGERAANRALHMAVVVRLRHDPHTRAYFERRTQKGLSKREIIRRLKRYLACAVFHPLRDDSRELRDLTVCGGITVVGASGREARTLTVLL